MATTEINASQVSIPTQTPSRRNVITTYLPLEHYIVSALEQLAQTNGRSAEEARCRRDAARQALKAERDPVKREEIAADLADARADVAFFQRASTAYTNGLREWQAGIRPERLPNGSYFLPSSSGREGHVLFFKDSIWECSCSAGKALHWPAAMMIAVELAGEFAALDADQPVESEPELEVLWEVELGDVPLRIYEDDCENVGGSWLVV